MEKNIFKKMFLLVMSTVALTSILLFGSLYSTILTKTKNELHDAAKHAGNLVLEDPASLALLETEHLQTDMRITYIAADGKVLYDSDVDATKLENHSDRQEVQEALAQGESYTARFSGTIAQQSRYYAYKLPNGNIIRTSLLDATVMGLIFGHVNYIALIVFLIFVITVWTARMLTKRTVAPINQINLQDPLDNDIYEEFTPMLNKLQDQKKMIERQFKQLRKQELEFASVTTYMKEGLLLLNSSGDIIFVNKSAAHILNLSETTKHIKYTQAIRQQELIAALTEAFKGETSQTILPVQGRKYQMSVSPILAENMVQGSVVLLLDVTEQLEIETRRKEFTANVSHELKTPLQSILGYAEIMSAGIVQDKDLPEFSQKIYKEAGRMSQLIHDILALSKLDEGETDHEVNNTVLDMKETVEAVVSRLESRIVEKQVKMVYEGHSFAIYQTQTLLFEMLYNLFENAIKYNKQHGMITVQFNTGFDTNTLTIRDTGIGIAEEDLPHIFERFYRGDKSRAQTIEGTGIGLAIVKHLAELQEIDIAVESVQGIGTTFTLTFKKVPNNI